MYVLRTIYAWIVFVGVAVRWFVWRAGLLARRPLFIDHVPESQLAWGQMTRWNPRIRVVGGERCPAGPPAVFAGNHAKLDDPFFSWRAAYISSNEKLRLRFMMRDDYFIGFPWTLSPIPLNHICEMGGGIPISRDNVSLSQLKPFLEVLREPGAFVMFPGRTRTRSGLVLEFREGFTEPGGVSFFLVHGQRRMPGTRIPCVPIGRSHHPATWRSAMVIGEPRYLSVDASREEQRDFDFALAVEIGNLIEIHVVHLVSGLLYLRCLHDLRAPLSFAWMEERLGAILHDLPAHRYRDPALMTERAREVRRAVRFLGRRGMLRVRGGQVEPNVAAVLAVPELDTRYRKRNPVKYYVNQIIHMQDVVATLEAHFRD